MKKPTAFLLSLMIASTFTACADKDTAKPEDSSASSSAAEDSASEESQPEESSLEENVDFTPANGTFDWDTAIDNFYLCGEKVSVPFSVNSLSGNYSVDGPHPYPPESYQSWVELESIDTGDEICALYFNDAKVKEYNDDLLWDSIWVYMNQDFNIQGIKPGTTLEEVCEIWGEPSMKDNTGYFYTNDNGDKIILFYDMDSNIVEDMDIQLSQYQNKED